MGEVFTRMPSQSRVAWIIAPGDYGGGKAKEIGQRKLEF